MLHGVRFRFLVFAISIPRLRTHAGAVASSRLVRRDLYSICFSSALYTGTHRTPRHARVRAHGSVLLARGEYGVPSYI